MIPTLTDEQRRTNLIKAATVRRERTILRKDLKAGLISFGQVFELSDKDCQAAANMRVKQAISAMPGYGLAKTQMLMRDLHIAESKRIKGLGVRQRAALLEVFSNEH